MVDIFRIEKEIVEVLKPLDPDKIVLFGSFAKGSADEGSDIDLLLVKKQIENLRDYRLQARKRLRPLIRKYRIGFDLLSAKSIDKSWIGKSRILYERVRS